MLGRGHSNIFLLVHLMLTSKLHIPTVPACNVAGSHATRVFHAILDADLHVRNTRRDVLIAIVHFCRVETQRLGRGVQHLKDTLCVTVTSPWTCRLAVKTTLDLCDLQSAFNPLFTKFFPDNLRDLIHDSRSFLHRFDSFFLGCLLAEESSYVFLIR